MQKKMIALAVTGLASGWAVAQSNVTVYGVVDTAYVYSTGERQGALKKNANFSGIQSGGLAGSRLGFKGQEDLGNGLKAVFTLEYALNLDADEGVGVGSTLKARQQWVGLKSATLGQIALGRQYAPAYDAQARNDSLAASAVASPLQILVAAAGATIAAASPARINNSVTYTSPKLAGFTVSGIYGFGENTTSATAAGNGVSAGDDGLYGLGLNYANGGLNVDAVYHKANDKTAYSQKDTNEWMIAGSYDFKVVKVTASYQDLENKGTVGTADLSNRVWSIGAIMPVFSKGAIHAGYADLDWDAKGKGGSQSWALGYTHRLSKRTTLYTTYTRTDNDTNVVTAAGFSQTKAAGEANSAFTAGINHAF